MNKEMMAANAAALQSLMAQSGGNMNPQLLMQYNQLMQFSAMNMNNVVMMSQGINSLFFKEDHLFLPQDDD